MKALSSIVVHTFIGLVVLVTGVGLGAYYHTELFVWWYHWFGQEQQAEVAERQSEPREATTKMALPGLEEELPLVFSETLDEPVIQDYLKEGAVVLPLGTTFGEPGNVVVTAHSSGTEAFGPYRFAFAKLAELEVGEEYSITTPKATYTYKVYGTEVVWPHEVDKLPNDDRSTVTLVTCWPLWTNFQRLLVHTELIGVDYNV